MTNTTEPSTDLHRFVSDWNPQPESVRDVIGASRARDLAATLDQHGNLHAGDHLPPLWLWVYFSEWPGTAELGADGHPRDGRFLPPIPHRRRMFAGGRVTMHQPVEIGAQLDRTSSVTATSVKQGRSGDLFFVTVQHTYHQDDEVFVVEEHDLVYRSAAGAVQRLERAPAQCTLPDASWVQQPTTSPPLLFRFSALTANSHRIHYDEPYTTGIEGFPGLVVHGPLLALYMAELVRYHAPDRTMQHFAFRLQTPVFVGDAITVQGTPDGSLVRLSVISGDGTEVATAQANLT